MGSAAVARYLGSMGSLPDLSPAALSPTLGFILPTTAQPGFGLGGISPSGALGAAALFVGSGAALSEATIATAAARAFLLAPVGGPAAVGSLALAALIAYALFKLSNPEPQQTPSNQAPPAPGAGTTYGVKTKRYRLELTGTTQGTSYEYTDYAGAYSVTWNYSVSQYGRTDWFGSCQTQVNAAPLSPAGGSLAKSSPGEGTGPPAFRVLEMGTDIPAQANEVSGVTVVTSPAQASSNATKTGIPGYPLSKGIGDPVAGRAPAVSQVPNAVPDRAPQTRLTDPKTGRTIDTEPGTGVTIGKDPLTGTTITTTPDILLPVPDQIGGIGQGTGTGTTVCPDPCPDLDLTPVLEAVAELSSDVADLSIRVGFEEAEMYRVCGVDTPVSSVQQGLTALDVKLGLEEAVALPWLEETAEPLCSVGSVLGAIADAPRELINIVGFEVPAPRDSTLIISFSKNPLVIHSPYKLSIPQPLPNLTKAEILAAVLPRVSGSIKCQLAFADGNQVQAWFNDADEGRAWLEAVSALSELELAAPVDFRAALHTKRTPALPSGTLVYPVWASVVAQRDGGRVERALDLR